MGPTVVCTAGLARNILVLFCSASVSVQRGVGFWRDFPAPLFNLPLGVSAVRYFRVSALAHYGICWNEKWGSYKSAN